MTPPEEKILSLLADYGSLSGVEIMSLTGIPDEECMTVVKKLADQKLVSISDALNIEDQAVTIQTKGVALASQLRSVAS